MPTTTALPVQNLKLDLKNFRTVPQPTEASAINALISINSEWFWALTESLLEDGYHPTENILVLQGGRGGTDLEVKEGNRRVAALKLIHGYARRDKLVIPAHIVEKIEKTSDGWKNANSLVPCAVYQSNESAAVDRIVTLTHGKGEKAGRDPWGTVPKARHNRDHNGASELGLDLLEKYLKHGKNVTSYQRDRWAGEYNLSILNETIQRIASRIGESSSKEVSNNYPKLKYRDAMESIFHDIGVGMIGFENIRHADFGVEYGLPAPAAGKSDNSTTTAQSNASQSAGKGSSNKAKKSSKSQAVAFDDPRAVSRSLRKFRPVGNNREKVVTLLEEARRLNVVKFPHAFCFLLRSMFEISVKAFCQDVKKGGGPSMTKPSGEERKLVEVLRDVTKHLTKNNLDKIMVKALHGAMAELGNHDGILSVTSMNQLVHNPKFVIDGHHISTVFANVFPLLEAMNS